MLLAFLVLAWLTSPVDTRQAPDLQARMQFYNRALGVECTHCHVDGKWTDASKPPFATAASMAKMVTAVNDRLGAGERVSCWTCHAGTAAPARQPRPLLDVELAKWPPALAAAPESQRLAMTVYNVALGVGCDHCHNPADWKDASKPPMKMLPTMDGLFEIFPKFMPPTARTQCFMCHKGKVKPVARPPAGRLAGRPLVR